jgi:hypothetical protein
MGTCDVRPGIYILLWPMLLESAYETDAHRTGLPLLPAH